MSESPTFFGTPVEWVISIVVQIFREKGDIRNCSCHTSKKLHEHRMDVVENVFEKRLPRIETVNKMQFGFIPQKITIDSVFIFRRIKTSMVLTKLYTCCHLFP